MDAPFTIASGLSYQASVMMPSGTVDSRMVTNAPGVTSTLTFSSPLLYIPQVSAPWVLQENNDGVRKFRVISLVEDNGIITVMASLYDEDKFTETDNTTTLGLTRTSIAGPQVVPGVQGSSIILEVPK
jgi:predicted phage tail protein